MAELYAYDPTRGYTVPLAQARVVVYVIDIETGSRYSTVEEANKATQQLLAPTAVPASYEETFRTVRRLERQATLAAEEDAIKAANARELVDRAKTEAASQAAQVTPSTLAAQEGGAIGAASIAAQLAAQKAAPVSKTSAADAAKVTPSALAAAESGAIGAASIASQIAAKEGKPTLTNQQIATLTPSTLAAAESGTIGATSIESQIASGTPGGTTGGTGGTGGTGSAGAGGGTGTGGTGGTGGGTGTGGTGGGGAGGGGGTGGGGTGGATRTVVSTYTDPVTGDVFAVYSDGTTSILSKGTKAAEEAAAAAAKAAGEKAARQSAYDLLFNQFSQYGLQSLVEPLKGLISENISPSEFAIRLRETPAYQLRFGANKARINKGLRALSEAEYIGLEDSYQNIMRQYGLPETYYRRGELGRQEGFEKFISSDVSPVELEDRIQTAQNRIINANPEIGIALKTFYPDISNGDILGYVLDPEKGLSNIKRRITAAEIGGTAVQLGLATNVTDAEYLARYGVTKEQAQQGYRTVAEVLPRGSFLGEIYGKQGMGPYTQATAEQEVFNVPGAAEAAAKRRKLSELETAQFSGQSGVGALARERAGQF
jgi:hypothetical protein